MFTLFTCQSAVCVCRTGVAPILGQTCINGIVRLTLYAGGLDCLRRRLVLCTIVEASIFERSIKMFDC